MRMPARCAARANAGAIRLAVRQGRQQVDAGETRRRPRRRSAARARQTDRPSRPRKVRTLRPGRFAPPAPECAAQSPISASYGSPRAIPFEHGEFRMVQRAALAVAEDLGEVDDPRARPPPTASCRQIPARCADRAGAKRRPGPSASSRKHADGSRCRARPATPRSRPRRSPPRQSSPARPQRCGCAPTGTAGGRHGRPRPRKAMRRGRWAASSP